MLSVSVEGRDRNKVMGDGDFNLFVCERLINGVIIYSRPHTRSCVGSVLLR